MFTTLNCRSIERAAYIWYGIGKTQSPSPSHHLTPSLVPLAPYKTLKRQLSLPIQSSPPSTQRIPQPRIRPVEMFPEKKTKNKRKSKIDKSKSSKQSPPASRAFPTEPPEFLDAERGWVRGVMGGEAGLGGISFRICTALMLSCPKIAVCRLCVCVCLPCVALLHIPAEKPCARRLT